MKEIVDLPLLNPAIGRLATPTSLLVRGGGKLYSCGIPPLNPENGEIINGSIEVQTDAVLSLMRSALEGAGSSMENVLSTTIFITDSSFFGKVNSIYIKYFPSAFPARSFVTVEPWPLPFQIEINCVALA